MLRSTHMLVLACCCILGGAAIAIFQQDDPLAAMLVMAGTGVLVAAGRATKAKRKNDNPCKESPPLRRQTRKPT